MTHGVMWITNSNIYINSLLGGETERIRSLADAPTCLVGGESEIGVRNGLTTNSTYSLRLFMDEKYCKRENNPENI